MPPTSFTCPLCGADIHPNARSCASCGGHRDRSGQWFQNPAYDGLDVPGTGGGDDDDFDYDDFLKREFGHDSQGRPAKQLPKPAGIPLFWWLIAIITFLAFASMLIRGLFASAG